MLPDGGEVIAFADKWFPKGAATWHRRGATACAGPAAWTTAFVGLPSLVVGAHFLNLAGAFWRVAQRFDQPHFGSPAGQTLALSVGTSTMRCVASTMPRRIPRMIP